MRHRLGNLDQDEAITVLELRVKRLWSALGPDIESRAAKVVEALNQVIRTSTSRRFYYGRNLK